MEPKRCDGCIKYLTPFMCRSCGGVVYERVDSWTYCTDTRSLTRILCRGHAIVRYSGLAHVGSIPCALCGHLGDRPLPYRPAGLLHGQESQRDLPEDRCSRESQLPADPPSTELAPPLSKEHSSQGFAEGSEDVPTDNDTNVSTSPKTIGQPTRVEENVQAEFHPYMGQPGCRNCRVGDRQCTKERPTCRPCAERGEYCIYPVMKPPGCDRCVSRKRGDCNMEQPACQHCQRLGEPCIYSAKYSVISSVCCGACTKAQTRCDGKRPKCSECLETGKLCIYADVIGRIDTHRPEEPPTPRYRFVRPEGAQSASGAQAQSPSPSPEPLPCESTPCEPQPSGPLQSEQPPSTPLHQPDAIHRKVRGVRSEKLPGGVPQERCSVFRTEY